MEGGYMASEMIVDGGKGGNEGSRRLGESKVYTRKSFKGLKNSRNSNGNVAKKDEDQILGSGSGNRIGNSRFDVASDDSSSLNHVHAGVVGGNGVEEGFLKQDNRIRIDLSMKTKGEVRELRRKLESELNLVRSLVRKIETEEGHKNGNGGGLKRVHSDVGSVRRGSVRELRPFNQLSVSVSENNQSLGENLEKEKRTPKANQFYKKSEFLLAKDKFPPAETNKKSKGNGKKGVASEEGDGFGLGKFSKQAFKNCSALLERLMKHKHGWVFNTPVDTVNLGLHDYYDVIKHPMDLGTVKSRLTNNLYKSPREFAEDVRLAFQNAMTYNPEGQDVYVMAEQLSKIFEDKWGVIETDYLRELKLAVDHGDGLPTPTSRKTARPQPPPREMARALDRSESMIPSVDSKRKGTNFAHSGRTTTPKKPKARDPNKREMTFEEKQKLSASLQGLPSEKLENVVQIIKKRNPSLCQHDNEIEVDIDSVDTETLWELDRFVTNYNRSLNKNKRKAEFANQGRPETEQNVQEEDLAPKVMRTSKEKKTEEKLISLIPAQVNKQGENAGRSSSTSSSSSGSGSSSSDSDSGSSRG